MCDWDGGLALSGVAGSIPFRKICSLWAAIRSNLLFNGLSKEKALKLLNCKEDKQAMKLSLVTAALIFVTVPVLAQDALTGVSTPPPASITTTDDSSPATPVLKPRVPEAKPSAAVPAASSNVNTITYGPYVPY